MSDLLISFYGDDFTGSTDAMESLALAGLPTMLFTRPPTKADLAKRPDLRAVGVAGMSRAMTPVEMDAELPAAFQALKALDSKFVHYKVCSTFDSSPTIGSIGRAIEIGQRVFGTRNTPVVAGAPSLRRHCVFGNLFASFGADGEIFRIDVHPSMSVHPTTPMLQADLRKHLAMQTHESIGLIDVLDIDSGRANAKYETELVERRAITPIDLLDERQLTPIGELLTFAAEKHRANFIVGSSGIGASLCAFWKARQLLTDAPALPAVQESNPILVVCGSCSPVTSRQIRCAVDSGFVEVAVNFEKLRTSSNTAEAINALNKQRSVVLHTSSASRVREAEAKQIGPILGEMLQEILRSSPTTRRIVIAGGDTSGHIARAVGIESLEMIGRLTRGAPLCRATAPGSPADGLEFVFKGGQIGSDDFFDRVRSGRFS